MRQGLIVIVLTLLIVVMAVGGGSALYILVGRTLFPAFGLAGEDWKPGVRVGEGYLTARDIPVAGGIDRITDIVHAELDPAPGLDFGLCSAEGVAILDSSYGQLAYNRIVEYVDTILFYQRRSDNTFFVYNREGYGEENEAATFDLSGKQLWKFTGSTEYAQLAVGDLDQDGEPEFAVQYSGEDDESTLLILDSKGEERSRLNTASVWGVAIAERLLSGKPALITIEDGDRLVFRSDRGHVLQEHPYDGLDGNLCVLDGFGDPERQCVLFSGPGQLHLVDGAGDAILDLTAPELAYPEQLAAAMVKFAADSPPLLAVLAPTYDYEASLIYLYTIEGTLTYFEVLDGSFASLLPLQSDATNPGRLLAGGENLLREFTRAPQAPIQQDAEQQPVQPHTAEQQATDPQAL